MQSALEMETKGKAEALRMKKKLEADVGELETSLEHANAANAESQRTIKKYHESIRGSQAKLEDEQRAKDVARDALIAADRTRRQAEQELADTNEQLSDLTCQNQAITGAKRKLESEMQTLHGEMDEMASEAHMADEKAKNAMVDA